jgi:hypothetical protein
MIKGSGMKKLRLFLATTALASAFIVGGAAPASANCVGEPVDACAAVCQVGLGNKYTEPFFRFCYVW